MPNDPFGQMAAQMNTILGDFTRGLTQMTAEINGMMAQQAKMLTEMAPHNLLAKAPITEGSGQFSAKMTTQQLQDTNIF